jgi:hypothetical protein
MDKLSLIGIVVGAALLTTAPVSIHPSSKSLVQLSLSKAEAQYGVDRRHYRRVYRRVGAYYGYGYPAYSYGYPAFYGYSRFYYGGWEPNWYWLSTISRCCQNNT